VLIPVTGDDLSAKQSEKQALVSRIRQLQTGLNFLGFGFLIIGMMLMIGKKED
jgi:tetrahydromethanopterin S-methyltransferase subunit F